MDHLGYHFPVRDSSKPFFHINTKLKLAIVLFIGLLTEPVQGLVELLRHLA